MKFLKKKEYDELINRLDERKKEIEDLTNEKLKLQKVVGMMLLIVEKWKNKKIGNYRAAKELAAFFVSKND